MTTSVLAADKPQPTLLFEQALLAVRRGDPVQTAALCWAYLNAREQPQQGAEGGVLDKRDSASFYLAEALEQLGYVHAAIDRYQEIVTERRAPQLVPRALLSLERLSRAHGYDAEEIAQEGVLTLAEFDELPPRLSSFVHFRQMIDDLRRGYDTWGQSHLQRVRDDTPYLPMALYARAVWRLSKGPGKEDTEAALGDLDQVIGHKQAPPDVRARALHQRARLRYESGHYAEAYADLNQVDVRFEPGNEVLLEKAWAKYREGDYRTALGLLHALSAPIYVERFAPERDLLRSRIFGKYCHFRAAKRAIEIFRQRFALELQALRDGAAPAEIAALREAAFERTATAGAGALHQLLVRMQEEREQVGRHGAWGSGKVAGSLNQDLLRFYDLKLLGARHREQQLLHGAADRVATELLNANEQMNLLEYEVGLGIYRRIGRSAVLADRDRPQKRVIPRVSDPVYYHFEGEYWSDELPDMQFFIEDRCVD